ncbi:MAG: enoyl-CoA hydratase-related protein [Mycobacterium sp.]
MTAHVASTHGATEEATTSAGNVIVECHDGVLTVTINRPARRNALDFRTVHQLIGVFTGRARESDIRVVVLTGTEQSFCAGADLQSVMADPDKPTVDDVMAGADSLVHAVLDLPVPVIAKVRGAAAGFGLSLALTADLVVAAENAHFVLSFVKRAAMPDGGASLLVPAAIGRARAAAMAMLGEPLSATRAQEIGLIHRICRENDLDAAVDELAHKLARGPQRALQLTKQAVNAATIGQLDAALRREREGQMMLLLSPDFLEAVLAFVQHRDPQFQH